MALTTSDLLHLADLRLREARVLQSSQLYDGAYYLGGYPLELGLKAVISSALVSRQLPDQNRWRFLRIHKIDELFEYACELKANIKTEFDTTASLKLSWEIALEWSVEARYTLSAPPDVEANARKLLDAVQSLKGEGILPWLKTHC